MSASSMSRVENHYSSADIRINTFFWEGGMGEFSWDVLTLGAVCLYTYIYTYTYHLAPPNPHKHVHSLCVCLH